MAVILVVEDDLVTRMLHLRALSRVEAITVGASTVAEALQVLNHEEPNVVVLDLELPDGSGLEVLEALAKRGKHPCLVVVSAHLELFNHSAWAGSCVTPIRKPVSVDGLREAVLEKLNAPLNTHPFAPAEYVQLACLGGHSVTLLVAAMSGSGSIKIHEGNIWAASWGSKTGFDAFASAVAAHDARIDVVQSAGAPGQRQLAGNWQEALLEAARLEDEERASVRNPSLRPDELDFSDILDGVVRPEIVEVPEPRHTDHQELIERGVQAVIARRYPDAVRAFERALEIVPNSYALRHRISRLRQLGY